MSFFLGIDFGTSGARGIVIDRDAEIVCSVRYAWEDSKDLISNWRKGLDYLLDNIPLKIKSAIKAIAINGTSSTVLLCDKKGNPVTKPLLYNDDCGKEILAKVKNIAPPDSVVTSATSSLTKLFWWYEQPYFSPAAYFLHQADWLGFLLHGKLGISDYHNALKLGYDVENLTYPAWLQNLPFSHLYPQVLAPGAPVGKVTLQNCDRFKLSPDCIVCTGTTDSIAAFIASGANKSGEAVTSLGSTLVLKLLSKTKVEAAKYGIYSHKFGNLWLVGGASNTGGAVLKHFFSDRELSSLSAKINLNSESPLNYYPLLKSGDRFPINDPDLQPQLEPRPDDPVEFLHGLLASMSRIEKQGYKKLQELGASKLTKIYTAGGGAKNPTWQQIRQKYCDLPIERAKYTEAAYGSALLAKASLGNNS